MVIAGLLCLSITPLAMAYAIMGTFKNPFYWKKYFPFLLISIFVLGYTYVPTGTPDLTRYVAIVEQIQNMDLLKAITFMGDNLYVENLFFWMVGAIGDLQLLAAVPGTIVYGVAIYITCDASSECGNEKYIPMLLVFQVMMMPFVSILNNVRCITAFSIVILATYLDIVKNVRKLYLIPLYILPCYFHSAAIIVVVLRLAVPLVKKMKAIVVMASLLLPNLVDILYANMGFIPNEMLKKLIGNVYWYYHDDLRSEYSQRIANSGADIVQRIIFFSFVISIIVIILRFFKDLSLTQKRYNTFVLLLCVATLGCVSVNTPQYWRFTTAVIISGTASVLLIVLRSTKKYMIKQLMPFFMAGLSLGGIFIQTWNNRYIVDYADWGSRFLLTDVYTIVGNVIRLLFI